MTLNDSVSKGSSFPPVVSNGRVMYESKMNSKACAMSANSRLMQGGSEASFEGCDDHDIVLGGGPVQMTLLEAILCEWSRS